MTTLNDLQIRFDDRYAYLRNPKLPWYQKDEGNCTRIEINKYGSMSDKEIVDEVNRGLNVEQITRVTGYFTKVGQMNKGKRGELKDRVRFDIKGG